MIIKLFPVVVEYKPMFMTTPKVTYSGLYVTPSLHKGGVIFRDDSSFP